METVFAALADETRLRILNLMRHGEVCVQVLTDVLELSQPKISRHLAYLRSCGLVRTRRDGKWIYYRIEADDDLDNAILNAVFVWMNGQNSLRNDLQIFSEMMDRFDDADVDMNSYFVPSELEEYLL